MAALDIYDVSTEGMLMLFLASLLPAIDLADENFTVTFRASPSA